MHMPRTTLPVAVLALTSGLVLAAGLPGCVGYNTYPKEPGTRGFTNPNDDPFPPLMTEALRWAITRYPADQKAEWSLPLGVPPEGARFAVNLPVGVSRAIYLRTAERIGYGAVPLSPETESLPTYHIARVWVNGDEAKLDIVRPVPGLPQGSDGRTTTQAITVRLRGGLSPWHVTSHRVWAINALPTPPLNYIPEPGAPTPRPLTKPADEGGGESDGVGEEVINLPA